MTNNQTSQSLQEVFSSAGLTVAVVFVDDDNKTHLTPDCSNITGNTRVVTDLNERGNWVCKCIPVPVPTDARLSGANGPEIGPSPVVRSAGAGAANDQFNWPSDLPKPDNAEALSTQQAVESWLANVPRKLTPEDIENIPGLTIAATTYVMQAAKDDPTNEFLVSVANACARYNITMGQAKGVLNWWRAQINRGTRLYASEAQSTKLAVDIRNIPQGTYLVDDVEVKINKPTHGNWNGFTFANDPDDRSKRYAMQSGDHTSARLSGNQLQTHTLLSKLASDPKAYAVAYGRKTGRCCNCGRELTDPESIRAGIGPICASKFGY